MKRSSPQNTASNGFFPEQHHGTATSVQHIHHLHQSYQPSNRITNTTIATPIPYQTNLTDMQQQHTT